jgi:hypothetical protein
MLTSFCPTHIFCIYACTSLIDIFLTSNHSSFPNSCHCEAEDRFHCLLEQPNSNSFTIHLHFGPSFERRSIKRCPAIAKLSSTPNQIPLHSTHYTPSHSPNIVSPETPCVTILKSSTSAATFVIPSELGVPIMRRHISVVHPR